MKLWLDDLLDDPDAPERHIPEPVGAVWGWVGAKTALHACRMIARGNIEHISFDHDLGDGNGSGYIVALFIEKGAYNGKIGKMTWDIHSANPIGRGNIERAMKSAERYWAR